MPDLPCLAVRPSAQSIKSHRGIVQKCPSMRSHPRQLRAMQAMPCQTGNPMLHTINNNSNNAQKHQTNSNAHLKPRSRLPALQPRPKPLLLLCLLPLPVVELLRALLPLRRR